MTEYGLVLRLNSDLLFTLKLDNSWGFRPFIRRQWTLPAESNSLVPMQPHSYLFPLKQNFDQINKQTKTMTRATSASLTPRFVFLDRFYQEFWLPGFPAKWRMRNEDRLSILMMRHYLADWLKICFNQSEAPSPRFECWNFLRRLISQTSLRQEPVVVSRKGWLFSQADQSRITLDYQYLRCFDDICFAFFIYHAYRWAHIRSVLPVFARKVLVLKINWSLKTPLHRLNGRHWLRVMDPWPVLHFSYTQSNMVREPLDNFI